MMIRTQPNHVARDVLPTFAPRLDAMLGHQRFEIAVGNLAVTGDQPPLNVSSVSAVRE